MRTPALIAVLASALPLASAFYLPGAAPTNYRTGERVEVLVNALTPMLTGKDDLRLVSMLFVYQISWQDTYFPL